MKNPILQFIIPAFLFLTSCSYFGPNPDDMTGNYRVQLSLDEKIVDTEEIREKLTNAVNEAGDSLKKVQQTIDREWDLTEIDTSTTEGKLEYISGKFAKDMTKLGADLGLLGKDLGNSMGDLAENALRLGGNALKNFSFQVELQKDGDIKMNDMLSILTLPKSRWEVDGNEFLIFDNQNKDTPTIFKISDRSKKGFVLKKESLIMTFQKQE